MDGESVKKLYALGSARWYDWFKKIWNKLVAAEAEKELGQFLQQNVTAAASILELGCGTALNLEKISALGLTFKKYLGLDFSPDMLRVAQHKFAGRPNVEFRQQDITQLDDIAEKFDLIICTWVLSHLPSPSVLVNRAADRLAPGGRFFLIFFATPRWYVRWWLSPLARYVFRAKFVSAAEVRKINKIKNVHRYSADLATVMEIAN
ncbi:MAG: class I SAM-dependent methyltransferase [Candidatus Magasanikbacteria bacterium]|nr:class I SAM-dependent methyltransferase [Candidatus Magasanikbacteria bacterium]